MPIKMWIDDARQPPRDEDIGEAPWVWVKTSANALEMIQSSLYISHISFDHDLGEQDTTMPVIRRLEELAYRGQLPYNIQLTVHSQNPVGRKNLLDAIAKIEQYLQEYVEKP